MRSIVTCVDTYVRPVFGLARHFTICHDLKYILDTDSCLSSLVLLSDDWNSLDDNCADMIWDGTNDEWREREERFLIARQKTKETRGGEEMRTFSKVETALSSLECLRVIWPINSFPVTRIECEGRTRIENKCAS